MLNKIVGKSLLKSYKLIIAIFLLFTVSQMLYAADKLTYPVLQSQVDSFYEKTNAEDFRIYALEVLKDKYDDKWVNEVQDKYNVSLEENEYNYIQGEDTSYGIVNYNEANKIDKIELTDGKLPENEGEVVLPINYADSEGIKVGDNFKLNDKDYKVSGLGYFVKFIYPLDLTTGDMSIIGGHQFVPLYMNEDSFKDLGIGEATLYFTGKFKEEPKDRKNIYQKIQNDYTYQVPLLDENGNPQIDANKAVITRSINLVPFILDREGNIPLYSVNQEIDGEQTMLNILSTVILIIALAIIIVLFNNIFSSQKKELGILKASGVTEKELSVRYTAYLFIILFIASIIGVVIGSALSNGITSFIMSIFYFPTNTGEGSRILYGITLTIPIIIFVVAVVYFVAIRRNLKKEPILLLRNIENDKPPKIRFKVATDRMNFINKYKVNILFRNIGISLLLIFGVFVSSFLLLMGGVVYTSFNNLLNASSDESFTYEYKVTYSEGVRDPDYDNDSMIIENASVLDVNNDTIIKTLNSSTKIYSYDFSENDFIDIKDIDGNELDKKTIYVSTLTQKLYNLEVGQAIQISNPYDATQSLNLVVGGIIENGMSNQVYIDIGLAQDIFDLDNDYANTHVGKGDPKKEVYAYDKEATYNKKGEEDNLGTTRSIILFIVVMISTVAIFISTITLSIITTIIISRNRKTISIMKVMGYTDREINSMVIAPYKWILIIVYFVSIPAFQYIIQQIISSAMADMGDVSISIKIAWPAIIIGFIAIFIIYLIALIVSRRSINRIGLAESLKTDE